MELKLTDYQLEAIAFAKKVKKSYMMMDMGTGKTAVALTWFSELPPSPKPRALVLGPKKVVTTTWPEEIEKWAKDKTYVVLHGKEKEVQLYKKADIYLLNYEGLPWFKKTMFEYMKIRKHPPFNVLIIDEGSMIKSWKTQRFKILKMTLPFFPNYRMILSGTPAPNSLLDLWAQYRILDDGKSLGTGITAFKSQYFTPVGYKGYSYQIRKGCKEQIYELIKPKTYRIDAKKVLDLPQVKYNKISCLMPDKAMQIYKQLEQDCVLEFTKIDKNDSQTISALFAASLTNKLRQIVQGAVYIDEGGYKKLHTEKVKTLKEIVDTGARVLCPIQFKFDLDIIKEEFPKAPYLGGGTKDKDAAKIIKEWNQKKIPLLVCHPLSVAHGLNMQAGSNIIVWYTLPWSLEQYLQLNARLHRMGQEERVIIHHLVMKDTVDEKVMKALSRKENVQQTLLDYFMR